MLRLLWRWFYLLPAMARMAGTFIRAYWYWKTKARKALSLPSGKKLSAAQINRWEHYFYGASYLRAVFCQLLGRSRVGGKELQNFAKLAALACFFDDLTDLETSTNTWPDTPEQFGQTVDKSGLALQLLQEIYRTLPPAQLPEFKQYLNRVFQLETKHRHALLPPELADLEAHATEKGANSVLLFRCLLPEPISEPERQALAAFGSLIQSCDDIFDLWFDRQNGLATAATTLAEQNDLEQLATGFERQVQALYRAVQEVPRSTYRRESSLGILCFLTSITRVCLRHYRYLKKKDGTLPLEQRSLMVVDMGRWSNRARVVLELLKSKCKM